MIKIWASQYSENHKTLKNLIFACMVNFFYFRPSINATRVNMTCLEDRIE